MKDYQKKVVVRSANKTDAGVQHAFQLPHEPEQHAANKCEHMVIAKSNPFCLRSKQRRSLQIPNRRSIWHQQRWRAERSWKSKKGQVSLN
jgi:hypothetical protein